MIRISDLESKAVVAVLLFMLIGCCPCRHLASSESDIRIDSTRVEYRERVTYIPDTVYIDIPQQQSERTTADSVSHLENDYAVSDARLLTGGILYHSLATKPQAKPVATSQKVVTQDSIVYKDRWRTVTKTVKVEKHLTWFQKAQIWGCWGLFSFVVITYTIKTIRTHIQRISKK